MSDACPAARELRLEPQVRRSARGGGRRAGGRAGPPRSRRPWRRTGSAPAQVRAATSRPVRYEPWADLVAAAAEADVVVPVFDGLTVERFIRDVHAVAGPRMPVVGSGYVGMALTDVEGGYLARSLADVVAVELPVRPARLRRHGAARSAWPARTSCSPASRCCRRRPSRRGPGRSGPCCSPTSRPCRGGSRIAPTCGTGSPTTRPPPRSHRAAAPAAPAGGGHVPPDGVLAGHLGRVPRRCPRTSASTTPRSTADPCERPAADVSSTAALEAVAAGVRVAFIAEWINNASLNPRLLPSGLLRRFDDIDADRIGTPDPAWLDDVFPASEGLSPAERFAQRLLAVAVGRGAPRRTRRCGTRRTTWGAGRPMPRSRRGRRREPLHATAHRGRRPAAGAAGRRALTASR